MECRKHASCHGRVSVMNGQSVAFIHASDATEQFCRVVSRRAILLRCCFLCKTTHSLKTKAKIKLENGRPKFLCCVN